MILVDVNIFVHAVNADSPFHEKARAWWDAQLSGHAPVCLAWVALLGFVRITTNGRILSSPLLPDEAFAYVDSWLAQPCTRTVSPREGHWELVRRLLSQAGCAGNLTTDAHLAALAIQHGCEVCSMDADFSRFPDLRWSNPIVRRLSRSSDL